MKWQAATYGAGKRHWFLLRGNEQLRDKRGRVRWFSAQGAMRMAERLNKEA